MKLLVQMDARDFLAHGDDEQDVAEFVQRALVRAGYRVDSVTPVEGT